MTNPQLFIAQMLCRQRHPGYCRRLVSYHWKAVESYVASVEVWRKCLGTEKKNTCMNVWVIHKKIKLKLKIKKKCCECSDECECQCVLSFCFMLERPVPHTHTTTFVQGRAGSPIFLLMFGALHTSSLQKRNNLIRNAPLWCFMG